MKRAYRVDDIRSAEAPLLKAGVPLMERAAWALSQAVIRYLKTRALPIPGASVLALVGTGNNGADTLFAAANLARRSLSVTALCYGAVHKEGFAAAQKAGVRIITNPDNAEVAEAGAAHTIWLDGLLGIGARGALREPLASCVRTLTYVRAHSPAEPYVIAVDVPSGVGIDDGTILSTEGAEGTERSGKPAVLRADMTVTMGADKRALYLPPACHYAGEIVHVPLGFEQHLPPRPALVSLNDADVRDLWIIPGVDDHKYTRGVLGILAGSEQYPGAGALAVAGARSIGIGMVRYAGEAPGVISRFPDVVRARGQVQAWAIGSGLTDVSEAGKILHKAINDGLPVVLDAGALELVYADDVPSTVILTPHEGELAALLRARGEDISTDAVRSCPAQAARLAATLTGATVLVKGSVCVIAAPHGPLFAQGGAPAWLATAGAGDVLAGIIGALLAMHGEQLRSLGEKSGLPGQLAAAGCHIHARAARIAARMGESGYAGSSLALSSGISSVGAYAAHVGAPVTAWDVAQAARQAVFEILNHEF